MAGTCIIILSPQSTALRMILWYCGLMVVQAAPGQLFLRRQPALILQLKRAEAACMYIGTLVHSEVCITVSQRTQFPWLLLAAALMDSLTSMVPSGLGLREARIVRARHDRSWSCGRTHTGKLPA